MKVSDEIIKVLEYLGEKIGVTIDWADKNVLPYVQQLCEKFVSWQLYTSMVWAAIGTVFWITGCCFIKPAKKKWSEGKEDLSVVLWIIAIVLLASGIPVFLVQIFDIVECMVFPEKAIYDYIQNKLTTMQ